MVYKNTVAVRKCENQPDSLAWHGVALSFLFYDSEQLLSLKSINRMHSNASTYIPSELKVGEMVVK